MADLIAALQAAAGGGDVGAWDLSYAYYDPPAAWDISTAVYTNKSFSVSAQETAPGDVFFKPDGTKMYVTGAAGDALDEYDLSTAWDVSTASFLQSFSVSTEVTNPQGFFFKPDGTKVYITGVGEDDVNEYDLSTAWDVSTASFIQDFPLSAQDANITGLFFKPDGLKMYMTGAIGDAVYEYDLSTAWDVSTLSYLQNFSVSTQDTSPSGLFFKPDGLKMYVVGSGGDSVYEYDLSTAWDVSTASYLQNFSVSAQDAGPAGIFLKPDGTKMYVVGVSGDAVYEYDLSSAWDVSSASYLQNFSVASQDTIPTGIFLKPDGTKMYIVGNSGDAVYEYDLSSAWNISTASYLQNFSVSVQDTNPQGLFFKDDGTQMFVLGNNIDSILSYTLGPQD